MRYQDSDIHLRYDRGRAVSPEGIDQLLAAIQQHVRRPVPLALDLGCGTGRFTYALSGRLANETLGIDVAQNMLATARQKRGRGARVEFVRATAEALPFTDASVDLVLLSQVLHHLDDPRTALTQIARVLRAGGVLAVRQTTRQNLDSYLYQRFFPEARAIDEARLPTRDLMSQLATSAAFASTSFQTLSHVAAHTVAEYVDRVALRSCSDLELIPDAAFTRGMASLRGFLAGAAHPEFVEECDVFIFVREY
jgi:ubiquinone/menaquinone biosynthesis C-methylase UbiE